MLEALRDVTDGLIRIAIYDDSTTIIDDYKTIAWSAASEGSMSMSSADIVFSVPADTVVSVMILYFYDGSTTYTLGITYPFEQQYTYNNAGTFTVTDVTLTVT